MKLLLVLSLIAVVSCSKESTDIARDVSGTYYCRDTTFEEHNNYPFGPYTFVTYNNNYKMNVSYIDRKNNIVLFRTLSYILDKYGVYKHYNSSVFGYTNESLHVSNNKLYYIYEANPGGDNYYKCITGEKVK